MTLARSRAKMLTYFESQKLKADTGVVLMADVIGPKLYASSNYPFASPSRCQLGTYRKDPYNSGLHVYWLFH
ncbi:hypothetical protein Plhal304r1_c034g0106571 [Plasmopara halstedii]